MAKPEKRNEPQKARESTTTLEDIRVTPFELAEMLTNSPNFELKSGQKIVIHNVDTNDLVAAISATDHQRRLQALGQLLDKLSLSITLDGSLSFSEFDIGDHSWSLAPGESGSLKITAKPAAVVKSVTEIVNLLSIMEVGQGFPLKAGQDLVLTGLSAEAMLNYHQFCQKNTDPQAREKGQDDLFKLACPVLGLKGLNLRIVGLNAGQVDRHIDTNAGGILFRATQSNSENQPHLILVLLDPKAKKSE